MIVKGNANGSSSDDELDAMFDGAESSAGHTRREPPPSYEASSTTNTSLSDMDVKARSLASDTSLGKSPAQLPIDDLITGSSSRPARRSLPPKPVSPREEQEPIPSQAPPPQQLAPSPEPPQQPEIVAAPPPARPQLPHAAHSAPDPRARSNMDHVQERDPFGNRFDDEGPFAAGRRAQRVDNGAKPDADPRVYVNGRMPSFKPGEILPVNTMRPATSAPPFLPPHQAPSFPPISHPPIRPAHFPPNLHPNPSPPSMPSPGQPSPTYAQPVRSQTMRHPVSAPSPPQSQPQPPPQPQPSRVMSHQQPSPPQPPQPMRSYSHGYPVTAPPPPQPPSPSAASQLRRHTYDVRNGIPPGLTPGGRYVGPQPGVPQSQPVPHPQSQLAPHPQSRPAPHPQSQPAPHSQSQLAPNPQSQHAPLPHGYPQSQPQAYPPDHPQGVAPQQHPAYQSPQPGRSILRQPLRHSLQTPSPSRSPLAPPSPTPVRLPSQNIPQASPHALGIVHTPPVPSGSPRPDPNRAPRSTPKPVMPQLLEPLAQANNYGRGGSTLQRSASAMPMEKSGLLSKTRSILRKRGSTSAIKTHADGAITFASQPPSSKRYENHAPLTSVKEESGGGAMGKLSKRLSKRK